MTTTTGSDQAPAATPPRQPPHALATADLAGYTGVFPGRADQVGNAMQRSQIGPRGKLPARSELACTLGINQKTVARAYQELADMGIIYLVPGHGYFPNLKGLR